MARTKGAKDKQPRKKRTGSLKIGVKKNKGSQVTARGQIGVRKNKNV